jgi:8-oxo-dGTP pyrophosphatase MutT (NUDIX family)
MERHEEPQAAVVREIREETGLHVEVERLLTARTFSLPRLDVVYVCRVVGDPDGVRGSGETPRWRWCPIGEYPPGTDPYTVELIDLAARDPSAPAA